MNADALSATAAARAALEALRGAAGLDSPLERHCLRQFAIAERLASERAFDRELLLCACWLHDVGLFTRSRDPYVTEGARLAARVLGPFGWPPERLQRCMDACEQHHAPRSRMAMGLEVELVRQSDLVDVTAGLVNVRHLHQRHAGSRPVVGLVELFGLFIAERVRPPVFELVQGE